MSATVVEVPFSELVQRPVDTVAKLAHGRTLRLHRRGSAEDLVLTTASRAELNDEVTSATTRLFVALLEQNRDAITMLVDVAPIAFPWARFLPDEEVRAFVRELIDTMEAAESLGNSAPVGRVITEWRHTAEVHADPELAAALRAGTEGDFGPVLPPNR